PPENKEVKTSIKKVKGTVLNFSISKQVILNHTGEEVYKFLKSKFLEDYKKRKEEIIKREKSKPDRIPITSISIKKYLDKYIRYWRGQHSRMKTESGKSMAIHYIDAYQSVRVSILGKLLPEEKNGL
ncbi:unnamed protein product, partial [marine sediment metagenome]